MTKPHPAIAEAKSLREEIYKMRTRRTWVLEDHLCMSCGGRILRCVTGNGITGGGNPTFMCANCGTAAADMGCSFCWCNYTFRNQEVGAYVCMPFSAIEEVPALLEAFRSCGCEPPPPWGRNAKAGSVGVVTVDGLRRARDKT